ncbi:hypothetical protein MTR67_038022 [Solanum verrucosum]|uniref:DUF4283 domain-containing protein n=1 Tax=Solanum verrucosum TaxID=315347 RepID=A0AAF0UER6_SOLVR|nr:hypothetical protein MTR67_038022 [Solanum verrucosum]
MFLFFPAFKCWCQSCWQCSVDFPLSSVVDADIMSFLNSAFELLLRVWAISRDLKPQRRRGHTGRSKDKNGKFSVNSAYKELNSAVVMEKDRPLKMIWKPKIPYKVNCFTWLLAKEAVLTQENLSKRDHQLIAECFLCGEQTETINHPFLHCKWIDQLWRMFICLKGIIWVKPGNIAGVLRCWNKDGMVRKEEERWKIVPACIWWGFHEGFEDKIIKLLTNIKHRARRATVVMVRLSSVEALGQMVGLITRTQLKAALPRLIPTILELYKRDQDDVAFVATCSLHNLLNASLLSENGPPLLDFEDLTVTLSTLLPVVCRSSDKKEHSDFSVGLKTYNEVQHCFLTVGLVYPEDLFVFLLNKCKLKEEPLAVGALSVLKHLLPRLSEAWHSKRPLLIEVVKLLLDELNLGVCKALAELIVVMASHCYLVGPSGELFIEYLVRHSAMYGLHRDDTERSRELNSSPGGYYPFVYKKVEAMEWISSIMREASKAKGNTVRRWKKKDDFTEIYCARNFNKYGRYISLINVRGIAEKIGRFIHSYKCVGNLETHRLVDSNIPYVDMLKSSKWTNKGRKDMPEKIIKRGGRICINRDANIQSEVLKKSLVGEFMTSKGEAPTLTEVRGWASSLWKKVHGLNIYDMGEGFFLFEFASKVTAEQVVEGDWVWRNLPVKMQWWSPTVCALAGGDRTNAIWIRVVGLPLHFWEHHTFKAIGDFCGGWIETEEETQLRNHLKWARIKIKGNGSDVPKEVTIDDGAFLYTMQVWTEAPARVTVGENNSEKGFTQRSPIDGPKVFVEDSVVLRGAADKAVQPRAMAETRGENFRTPNVDLGLRVSSNKSLNADLGFRVSGSKSLIATLGQLGQFSPNSSGKNKEVAYDRHMPFNEGLNEIKILASQFLEALSHWESSSKLPQVENSTEKGLTPMKIQGEKSDIHQETAS